METVTLDLNNGLKRILRRGYTLYHDNIEIKKINGTYNYTNFDDEIGDNIYLWEMLNLLADKKIKYDPNEKIYIYKHNIHLLRVGAKITSLKLIDKGIKYLYRINGGFQTNTGEYHHVDYHGLFNGYYYFIDFND